MKLLSANKRFITYASVLVWLIEVACLIIETCCTHFFLLVAHS